VGPQVGVHWLAVRGSILTVVSVGHKDDFGSEGSEGRRSSERDLGRVHVLMDEPWRM
jgi:hypothetical protein